MLKDKVLLITGGSRGIGEATVRLFAKEGAAVAFTYINSDDKAARIVDELSSLGIKCIGYKSDASSMLVSENLVKKVVEDFGRIDILINNAGITHDNLIVRMTEEQWDLVVTANLKSVFNITRSVLKFSMRKSGGKIINISSIVGVDGGFGQSNYAASKAGIIGFTKSVAKEMAGRNIAANVIIPGFIVSDMTATVSRRIRDEYVSKIFLERLGDPGEVANVCLFLASDMASFVNGTIIRVDGGM